MNGVTLRNNKASGQGGALSTDDASPYLLITATNCTFEANQTTGSGGGAVEIQNGNAFGNGDPTAMKIVFTNCTFTGNLGSGTGGAVDIRSGSYVKFDGVTATGNKSTKNWDGGFAYVTSEYSRIYVTGTITQSGNVGTKGAFISVKTGYTNNPYLYTSAGSNASWLTAVGGNVKYNQTIP
jgi:predicted outer membrane repeat protein